jgi:hypothetical protein
LAQADVGPVQPASALSPAYQPRADALRRVLRDLRELPGQIDAGLRDRIRQPLPWRRGEPVRPADVREHLESAMFAPENLLEDARYLKIVPNEFVVELNPQNYEQNYRLIEQRIIEQWHARLQAALQTANQRQGRQQYQWGGRLSISLQPGPGLAPDAVRIRTRIVPDQASREPPAPAERAAGCLELMSTRRRWPLSAGRLTIGRADNADLQLSEARADGQALISSYHAYLVVEGGEAWIFDGSPAGRPSTNGTFVNGRRVGPQGQRLADGDVVVLAPLRADDPRPEVPGTVALRYWAECR